MRAQQAIKNVTQKARLLLAALLLLGTQAFAPVSMLIPSASAAAAANLDQWANAAPASWQNGNLNESNSTYREGDSVAYRMKFSGLTLSTHSVTIEWDTTKSGKHAIDYLTSYNRTEATANPCSGVAGCGSPSTYAIPDDPNSSVAQVPGVFTLFNGTINSLSAYTVSGNYAGDSSTKITVNFTASNATPVLAWGGHIAKESEWGIGNGASAVSGSPYHQRLLNLDGSAGNQDRSLKASAVVLLPRLTITKVVQNGTALPSDFTFTVNPSINGTSVYPIPAGQNSVTVFDIPTDGNYTVTESGPNGYGFVGGTGTNCTFNSSTATATVAKGTAGAVKNASCTFTNGQLPSSITIVKDALPNSLQDFSFTASGTGVSNFMLDDDSGVVNATNTLSDSKTFSNLTPGSYTFTEGAVSGWDFDNISCSQGASVQNNGTSVTITLAAGQNVTCTYTNRQRGTITVHKVTVPAGNQTGFSITASGTGNIDGNDTRTLTTAQDVVYDVAQGTYAVNEDLSNTPGWTQTNSTCSNLVIDTSNLNASCTITNAKLAKLKIVKNAQPNSAQDFSFTATGTGVTNFTLDDDADATLRNNFQFSDLTPGDFTFTEGTLKGWSLADITCTGIQNFTKDLGNKQLSITLAYGDDVTCTFVNQEVLPVLTLVKIVSNLNGGTKEAEDFVLKVSGNTVTNGLPNVLQPGSYVASEVNLPGYTAGSWTGDCDANGNVMLELGDIKTCTITNYDQPGTLIVKKVVVNDNGGSKKVEDFSFSVNGNSTIKFEADGQNDLTVNAGTYTVTEPAYNGYATSYDNCNDIVIPNGGTATCTITNNDVAPKLKLVKYVTNDNGGNAVVSDFPLFIDGNQVTSGVKNTVTANVLYTATETNLPGYTAGNWGGDCAANGTITLLPGDDKTCTITNDDVAPTLTLIKKVINDNGGKAGENDFGLTIGGASVTSGQIKTVNANTPIAINEAGLSGYQFVSITGDAKCPEALNGTITLNEGENVTCTITNDDVAPKLTITKKTLPAESEQAFSFTSEEFDGFSLTDGESITFDGLQAGDYDATEVATKGWKLVGITCEGGEYDTEDGTLWVGLGIGDEANCVFTNEQLNTIQGHKFNDVNGNHKWDDGEPALAGWTIKLTKECVAEEAVALLLDVRSEDVDNECAPVTTTAVTNGNGVYSFTDLDPGTYTVCEVQKVTWTQTYPQDNNGCHNVAIKGPGEVIVADFGNKPKPQVLSETTLVNTGSAASTSVLVGLTILAVLGALYILARRRGNQN